MAQSYRSRFLAVQRSNEAAMKTLFTQLANALGAELVRRADADGNVPRSATFDIQQAAGELVRRLFLGRNAKGEFAPFDTVGNGALIPLSPYMRVLWESIKAAVRIPVEQNAVILANKLPATIAYTMRTATRNPFPVAKAMVAEQVFRPNPLAAYEAPHTWVDPNGYRLSDRIWNTAVATRRQLDLYLDTAIREGRGALAMSRELQAFLIPGRSLPTTNKPYGTTASFDAMRLARTVITRAHGRAAEVSAAMNPFVSGMKWNLSGSHPRIDICDQYARGGKNGDGVYPLGEIPSYPAHPHEMCYLTNVLIENPDAILEELRADIQAAKQEFVNLVGPLEVERFTQLLLGQGLETEYQGVVTRTVTPPVIIRPPVVRTTTVAPTVTPSPPPVDLAAEARRQVIALDREYAQRLEKVEDELIGIAREITAVSREIDRLDESVRRQKDPDGRLQARLEELRDERFAIIDRRRGMELAQGRLEFERNTQLQAALRVDRPARVTMNAPDVDADKVRIWQRGVDSFNNLMSADVVPEQTVNFVDIASERSNYNPDTKFVRIGNGLSPERAVVHELGHWLEDHNPELHRQVLEFYDRRTKGYPLEWMGAGFRGDETTRRDKFMDEYMGKEYVFNGDRYATEILSMGIEFMHDRPAEFARRDPEMFDFIFNLARGQQGAAVSPAPARPAPLRTALEAPASRVPQPSQSVIDTVEAKLDTAIARLASRYKTTPAEVEATVAKAAAELTDPSKPVSLRASSGSLDAILDSGRFKSQFETGTSGAVLNKELRAEAEEKGMGIARNVAAAERPIYGYIANPQFDRYLKDYGDLIVEFKSEIRERTTVMMGDSLTPMNAGQGVPAPLNSLRKSAWDGNITSLYETAKGEEEWAMTGMEYVEVQIHGQAKVSDIARIRDTGRALTSAQLQRLRGLDITVVDKDGKELN